MTCGMPLKALANVIWANTPAGEPVPTFTPTVPAVSVPLIETVPPLPSAVPPFTLGVLPPASMWLLICRSPLKFILSILILGALIGPAKLADPDTVRPFGLSADR